MTEQEINRGLRLVRYGGVVVTVTVFVALLAFAFVTGGAIDKAAGTAVTGEIFNNMLPYVLILTLITAVLSILLYFGYRAYLMNRAKSAEPAAKM